MTETERMYAYFICSIPMIGGVRAGQLLSRFGDPQGVYEAGTAGWREILSDSVVEYMDRQKKSGNLEEEYHSLGEKQIGLVLQEEEGFPRKLLEIPDPPYGLFYKGKLPEQKQPSVAESVRNTADMWPRNWDSIWEEREYRSSAEWQEESMGSASRQRFWQEGHPTECWDAEWISVIPARTGNCTRN